MPVWFRSGIISSVGGIWSGVPITRSLFISHNFFATERKTIYAAYSGRKIFLLVEINNATVHVSSREFEGRNAGSFTEQRLVIEPISMMSGVIGYPASRGHFDLPRSVI